MSRGGHSQRVPGVHRLALVSGLLLFTGGAVATPGVDAAEDARTDEKSAVQEAVYSGPQPGEKVTPFKVLPVTGKQAGKEVEIVGTGKGGPTFILFLHKITEPAIGLMIPLEWYAKKIEGLTSHYVILTSDRVKTERQAKRWWSVHFAGSTLSISADGAEGPGLYGLNRKVTMTVVLARDNKVAANFALEDASAGDAPEILNALAKLMGKPAPSYEKIRKEVRAERARRREMRRREHPVVKLAPEIELGKLMLRMIQTEIRTAAHFKKVGDDMRKWVGDDERKKNALARYCRAVLEKEFELSEEARKVIKKLAGQ